MVLRLHSMEEFKIAAAQAVEMASPSERAVCAGNVSLFSPAGENPEQIPGKMPYYVVTTEGIHCGVLVSKKGLFSRGDAKNVFISRERIRSINTDYRSAADLQDERGEQLAFILFSDIFSHQFIRSPTDTAPPHPGHYGDYSAAGQIHNVATSLGLSI